MPSHIVITWMERVAGRSNPCPGCFLLRYLYLSSCRACFEESMRTQPITPFTFLIAFDPNKNSKALDNFKCSLDQCADFDVKPFHFCECEFGTGTMSLVLKRDSSVYDSSLLIEEDDAAMVQVF